MPSLPCSWNPFGSATSSKAARESAQRRSGLRKRRSFFEPLEQRRVMAFMQSLVADINEQPSSADSSPQNFVEMGSLVYFSAASPAGGRELWKSDGTAAGTVQVMDINPGSASSDPGHLINIGGTLYFTAKNAADGMELWKSNGTAAGTVQVKDINAGATSSAPSSLTNMGGTLYFCAQDEASGYELWKSDGTAEGTVQVKDIYTGAFGSFPFYLANVDGTLYFNARDIDHGRELWKSDGTASGTMQIKDIFTGTYQDRYGFEVINSGDPRNLTNVGGILYFRAQDAAGGSELWKSDGTDAGTLQVKDIGGDDTDSLVQNLTNVGNTLYFTAQDATGSELWKSDGTTTGTVQVKDIVVGSNPSSPSKLINVGGVLFFRAFSESGGFELWKSDGTAAGTLQVKDINSGTSTGYYGGTYPNSSDPQSLTDVGGTLLFQADGPLGENLLWQSDGTSAGTLPVFVSGGMQQPLAVGSMALAGNNVFFQGIASLTGAELWKVTIANTPGAIAISGTATANQTLTATVSDVDGSSGTISYQWQRNTNSGFIDITGATANTYVLTGADVGATLLVTASYTDDQGFSESLASNATSTVIGGNTAGAVSITGTAKEDQTLTANVSDVDGVPATVAYQWQRKVGLNFVNIAGATGKTYVVKDADVGTALRVRANYSDNQGSSELRFSGATGTVVAVNDVGTVSITGTVKEDQTLTANVSDADGVPATVAYQWQRKVVSGFVDIGGATAKTYLLKDADVGTTLRVRATYTDNQGFSQIRFSGVTGAVVAVNDAGTVSISGKAKEDQTLTANVSDVDGIPATVAYQWQRKVGTSFVNISGATGKTYKLGDADVGKTIRVQATYSDGQAFAESRTSAATAVVANVNDAPALNTALNPTLTAIAEDPASNPGTSINALVGGVTDADAGAVKGIALSSVSNTANGRWEYSINNGSSWVTLGAVSAGAARLLKADGLTRLRFVPNLNFNGTVQIGFYAWDRTHNPASGTANVSSRGGSTAFSQNFESATLKVTSVADAPQISVGGPIGYKRNDPAMLLAATASVTDADSGRFTGGLLRVRLTAGAGGSNLLAIGTGFTVDANNIVRRAGVIIGERTSSGVGTAELAVKFSSNATAAIVEQLVRSLTFKSTGGTAGQRKVVFSVSDGSGGMSKDAIKTVNVT